MPMQVPGGGYPPMPNTPPGPAMPPAPPGPMQPPGPPMLGGMPGVQMYPDGSATVSAQAMAQLQTIFSNQGGGSLVPQGPPPGLGGGPPPLPGAPPMLPPAPAPVPPGPPMGMPPMGGSMPGQGAPPGMAMPPIPGPPDMGIGMPPDGAMAPPPDIAVPGGASVRGGKPSATPPPSTDRFDRGSSSSKSKSPTSRFANKKTPKGRGR